MTFFPPAGSHLRPSGSKPNDYIFGLTHDCIHGNLNGILDVIICYLGMDAKNVPDVPGHINMYYKGTVEFLDRLY